MSSWASGSALSLVHGPVAEDDDPAPHGAGTDVQFPLQKSGLVKFLVLSLRLCVFSIARNDPLSGDIGQMTLCFYISIND
jgi:hypothetical protein